MQLPAPLKALLFDWDNTLADSWPTVTKALNAARAAFGLQTWTVEEAKRYSTRAMRDSFPEWFGDRWEEAKDIFYGTYEAVNKQSVVAMPGADALVRALAAQNWPMGIVSNKRGDLLRAEVEGLGWASCFQTAIGSYDAPHDKPARDPVDVALAALGLTPQDAPSVVMIGDSSPDVVCARASGTIPILIAPQATADELKVEIVFPDCQSLLEAFKTVESPFLREKKICPTKTSAAPIASKTFS